MRFRDADLCLTGDVAKILGCSPSRVAQLARTGRLRHLSTPGGVRLFRRADVARLKAERERQATDLADVELQATGAVS
jgi:excisionase family DNA binding protein